MGRAVAGDASSYQRRVKPLICQNEAVHAYPSDLLPDGKPPTKNGEPGKLVLDCESNNQGHGSSLTKPAKNDPIRGDAIVDLLCDELIYLIPGPKDPVFVFWAFELETEDVKPKKRGFSSKDGTQIRTTHHPGISTPLFAVHGTVGLSRV
jgi:hypothetical protein